MQSPTTITQWTVVVASAAAVAKIEKKQQHTKQITIKERNGEELQQQQQKINDKQTRIIAKKVDCFKDFFSFFSSSFSFLTWEMWNENVLKKMKREEEEELESWLVLITICYLANLCGCKRNNYTNTCFFFFFFFCFRICINCLFTSTRLYVCMRIRVVQFVLLYRCCCL